MMRAPTWAGPIIIPANTACAGVAPKGAASRSIWFTLWVGLKGTYTSELHLKSLAIPASL